MIRVSDHPLLKYNDKPIKRYVESLKKIEDQVQKKIVAFTKMHYFIEVDWQDVLYEKIPAKDLALTADNTVRIDMRTGNFADENTEESYIVWEYDFIRTQKGASLEELEIGAILRADALWRFGI